MWSFIFWLSPTLYPSMTLEVGGEAWSKRARIDASWFSLRPFHYVSSSLILVRISLSLSMCACLTWARDWNLFCLSSIALIVWLNLLLVSLTCLSSSLSPSISAYLSMSCCFIACCSEKGMEGGALSSMSDALSLSLTADRHVDLREPICMLNLCRSTFP
jgi:hypothetical protein